MQCSLYYRLLTLSFPFPRFLLSLLSLQSTFHYLIPFPLFSSFHASRFSSPLIFNLRLTRSVEISDIGDIQSIRPSFSESMGNDTFIQTLHLCHYNHNEVPIHTSIWTRWKAPTFLLSALATSISKSSLKWCHSKATTTALYWWPISSGMLSTKLVPE